MTNMELRKVNKNIARVIDYFFVLMSSKFFQCLGSGTANSKALHLAEITMIIDTYFYKGLSKSERIYIFFQVFTSMNSENILIRMDKLRIKFPEMFDKTWNSVNDYFTNNKEAFKNNQKIVNYIIKATLKNLLHNQNVVADSKRVICYDTTERQGNYIILVQDVGSRYLLYAKIFLHKPSAEDIRDTLKETIDHSKIDPKNIIIHGDCAGKNTSQILIEFLTDLGVAISYAVGYKNGNSVVEAANRMLWDEISKLYIDGQEESSFLNFDFEQKKMILLEAINRINKRPSYNSTVIPKGCSAEDLHNSGCLFKYTDTEFIIAKNGSEMGKNIKTWKTIQVMLYKNTKIEDAIKKKHNLSLGIASYPEEESKIDYPKRMNKDWLDKKKKETKIKHDILQKVSKMNRMEIKEFLINWVKTEEAKSLSNYKKIILHINLMNAENIEITKGNTEEIKTMLKEVISSNKKLLKKLTEEKDRKSKEVSELKELLNKEVKQRKEKEDLRNKKLLDVKKRKIKPKEAIHEDAFFKIINNIPSKNSYFANRDRIAHGILYVSGIENDNLSNVCIDQLNAFFNYQIMIIRPIKSKNQECIRILVDKETYGNIVEALRPYWITIQETLKNKRLMPKRIYKLDDPNKSVIWGDLRRDNYCRRLNRQIENAGISSSTEGYINRTK